MDLEAFSRKVTGTGKKYGNIASLCNRNEEWRSVSAKQAIQDIEAAGKPYSDNSPYYTNYKGIDAAIVVMGSGMGKYLRTDPDKTTKNNLEELPDC